MSHEQSETKQFGSGWRNMYGRNTARAGMPIPHTYEFEKTMYPTLQEALGAAITRSELEGRPENETPYSRLMHSQDGHSRSQPRKQAGPRGTNPD